MGLKKSLLGLAMVVAGFVGPTFAAPLSNFTYSGSTYTPSATATYTFAYTVATDVAANEYIAYIIFDSNFNLDGITSGNINITVGGVTKTIDNFWNVGGDGAFVSIDESVTAGSDIVISINGIINPAIAGNYPFTWVRTSNGGGNPIDEASTVPPVTIAYLTLEDFSWTGTNFVPGATGSYTFSFTATDGLASYPNGVFYFWFPFVAHEWWTGANFDNDIDIVVNNTPAVSSGSSIQNGERIWILPQDAIPTGANVSITLNNVVNYNQVGSYNWTTLAETNDYIVNERRVATSMNPIVLSYPPISLQNALDRCNTNSGSINVSYNECTSLAYLWNETDGNNWTNHSNWFTNTDIGTREGRNGHSSSSITLSGGHAIEVDLSSNGLSGAIISGLNNLNYIQTLGLSYNNVSSIYLPAIDSLSGLSIGGNILTELDISRLTHLQSLDADSNQIYSFTSSSNNSGLLVLNLYSNALTGIDLSHLASLSDMVLGYNQLASIDLIGIPNIRRLELYSNQLNGSLDVSTLPYLYYLDLSSNQLENVILGDSSNLQRVYLGGNLLTSIDLSGLTNLHEVDLHFNDLSTLDISANAEVSSVDASYNGLNDFVAGNFYPNLAYYGINVDHNGLCEIDNLDMISLLALDLFAENDWRDVQTYCRPRAVHAQPSNTSVTLSRTVPVAGRGNPEDGTPMYYVVSIVGGTGEQQIDNDVFSYTFEGLSNNTAYTFKICAAHPAQPARIVCETVTTTPTGGETPTNHGGGGGGSVSKDSCLNGDTSPSYYDGLCGDGAPSANHHDTNNNQPTASAEVSIACLDPEYQAAYDFSFQYHITTMPTCIDANMDGLLLRSQAAKMMANYAINVLGKTPDNTKACDFSDMSNESPEMQQYAIAACRLGIMGLEFDGATPSTKFNPNATVDKAQFATILDRLINGRAHDGNDACRYCDHVSALQDAGVITVTTDLFDPLQRAFAMIMLMRSK